MDRPYKGPEGNLPISVGLLQNAISIDPKYVEAYLSSGRLWPNEK